MKYVCVRDCQRVINVYSELDGAWRTYGEMFREGDILDFPGTPEPCMNPKCRDGKVITGKKESMCPKCSGTMRSKPSHHFMPMDSEAVQAEKEEQKTQDVEGKKQALRGEIKEIGGDFDHRWGIPMLEKKLLQLKKEKGI